MTRRHLTFDCAGATLVGTLDMADGATGLLIVSGGNELRSGAWAGQAKLAARIAEAGYPVFRFDRRGVGDSEGANGGFRSEGPDIDSAIAAFRAAAPRLERIVGLGNCDAASALMLARGAGLDALLLANPWTTEDDKARDPPEVIWAHYRQRLASKTALMRLLSGRVKFRAIAPAIAAALAPTRPGKNTLVQEYLRGIGEFTGIVRILLAERDRTAQAFLGKWNRKDPRIRICAGASHSFVEPNAQEWLAREVLGVLAESQELPFTPPPAPGAA